MADGMVAANAGAGRGTSRAADASGAANAGRVTSAGAARSGSAPPDPEVRWSDALAVGDPLFDDMHREFVELIATLARADDAAMPAAVEAAISHTQAHFRQETTLMQLHGFPPIHCHDTEHAKVLEVMLAVRERVAAGETEYGRTLAAALMEWLHVHVPTMDFVLATWLRERGVDASV